MSGAAAGVSAVGGGGANVRFAGHTPYHPRVRGLNLDGGGDGGLRGRQGSGGMGSTPQPASAAHDCGTEGGGIGATGGPPNVEVNGGGGSVPPDDDDGFDFAPPPPRASTMTGSVRGGGVVGGVARAPSSPSRPATDARTATGTGTATIPVVEPEEEEVIDGGGEDLAKWVVAYGFPTTVSEDRDSSAEGDDDDGLDVDTGLTELASMVLRRFEGYGEVTGRRVASLRRPGGGGAKPGSASGALPVTVRPNWIALRYATVLQAEKALCQNGTAIGGGGARGGGGDPSNLMFVAVKRMDPATARLIFGGGGAAPGRGGVGSGLLVDVPAPPLPAPRAAAPVPPRREADGTAAATEEDVLLLRPAPGTSLEGGGMPPRGLMAMFLAWIFNW